MPTSQRASRKRTAPACYTPAPSEKPLSNPLPVDLVLALRLHDFERHRLHGRGRALSLELALELLLRLLLVVLALRLSAAARHVRPPARLEASGHVEHPTAGRPYPHAVA